MLTQGLGQIASPLTSRLEAVGNLGSTTESLDSVDAGGISVGIGGGSSKVGKVTIKVN